MDQVMARKVKDQGRKGVISKIKLKEGQVIEETIKVGIGLIQILHNTINKIENPTRIAGGEIMTGGPVHLTASSVVLGLLIEGLMREDDHRGEGREEGDTEGTLDRDDRYEGRQQGNTGGRFQGRRGGYDGYGRSNSDFSVRRRNSDFVHTEKKSHSSPHRFEHSKSVTASMEDRAVQHHYKTDNKAASDGRDRHKSSNKS